MARTKIEAQTAVRPDQPTAPRPTTQMVIGCLVIPLLLAIGIGAVVFWTWRSASAEADETPAHTVTLSSFAMDRTEVTVSQYWQCVQMGVCAAPAVAPARANPTISTM